MLRAFGQLKQHLLPDKLVAWLRRYGHWPDASPNLIYLLQ
jgi:hypothetical protein